MSIVSRFGLFCDGTGNDLFNALRDAADADEPTNVAKLYRLYRVCRESPASTTSPASAPPAAGLTAPW